MNENNRGTFIKRITSKLGCTGFFHVFGSTAINKIISFASGIVLVRLISKSEYGIFSYANNLLNFFMIACGLGAASGILQMCSEQRDELEKKRIYAYASRSSFIANCLLSIVILLVSIFIPLKIEGANFCLGMMAFLPIFSYTYEMQIFYLRTQRRNKEYSYSNTFSTVTIFVLSCTLSYFFQIKGLVAAKYIAFSVSVLFVLWRFRVDYPATKKSELSAETKKQFWGISAISMLNNGMSSLMYMLDIFVLGIVVPDSTVVASYKLATNIPTALAFIPAAFVTYIYPYFALHREDKAWVRRKYILVAGALAVFCSLISLVMFIFAPFVIKLLFGAEYLDALPCFRILSISFALSAVFRTLPGNILVTQRRLKFNLFTAIFSSAVNTVLNVIFITRWKSIGAAYATLVTVIVTGILDTGYLTYILSKKKCK
jgi:polysaccharide biosynthesis protein